MDVKHILICNMQKDNINTLNTIDFGAIVEEDFFEYPTCDNHFKYFDLKNQEDIEIRKFFMCDLFDCSWKDDGATMEAPIFTLATKPDLRTWTWSSKDRTRNVKVIPSSLGRATQMDKDVLIFIVSQIIEGLNIGREDAKSTYVRFTINNYLKSTKKKMCCFQHKRVITALDRMTGTKIQIKNKNDSHDFSIFDTWEVAKRDADGKIISVDVKLSEWIYKSIQDKHVLTINPDYFRLRKPLERRLYELARKHCGQQAMWKIGIDQLKGKCVSFDDIKKFKYALKIIIKDGLIPDYELKIDDCFLVVSNKKVTP